MTRKVRALLGTAVLAWFLAIVVVAGKMTFEWMNAKPDDGAAMLMWQQLGGFVLLTWGALLWLGSKLFLGNKGPSNPNAE